MQAVPSLMCRTMADGGTGTFGTTAAPIAICRAIRLGRLPVLLSMRGTVRPLWPAVLLAMAGGGLAGILLSAALLAASGRLPLDPRALISLLTNPTSAAPTSGPLPGSISGAVWADDCAQTGLPATNSQAPAGCRAAPDGLLAGDGQRQPGEPGLSHLLVRLGAGDCPASGLGQTLTDSSGRFIFSQIPSGRYCVTLSTGDANNRLLLGPGMWTSPGPSLDSVNRPAVVTSDEPATGVDFSWSPQGGIASGTPSPSASAAPTATLSPSPTSCTEGVGLVEVLQTPDGTIVSPGKAFQRVWRLKNTGTCVWSPAYALVFDQGESMGAPLSLALTTSVAPNQTLDLALGLTAPTTPGAHSGSWLMRDSQGERFGTGAAGDQPLTVKIVVSTAAQPAQNGWKGEYFNNPDLNGPAKLTRTDTLIDFDWGRKAPAAGLPTDDFSVRWTGKASFDDSAYRFRVWVDDGARLLVDGDVVLDAWEDGSARELTVDIGLAKGTHSVVLEYYEHAYDARVRLGWEKVASPTISHWKGEYWPNESLSGTPRLVRDDENVDFRWTDGAPVGLPVDSFSARWTRTVKFSDGDYQFSVKADDGVRVFIDGTLVLDEWHTVTETTLYTFTRHLSGKHSVKIEYFEHHGQARAMFDWERLSAATATPTASETPETPTDTLEPTNTDTP